MPLLWFRVASDGSGSERYTLQVPFQLGSTHNLTSEDVTRVAFGEHNLEVIENQGIQLLRVTAFKTAQEAEAFFPRLRGSLLRLIVKKKLSVKSTCAMQRVKFKEPPVEVSENSNFWDIVNRQGWTHIDGFVDPSPAVVIPEHLRIMEAGGGSVSVRLGMPLASILEHIVDGLQLPQLEMIATDERLSLAIQLYAASLWETSQRTRVVALATALEALIAPGKVSQESSDKIDECLQLFDSARDPSVENKEQRRALDRMRSRLANLKEESISETLRELVAMHATALCETTEDARRNVVAAYGVRSKLVHDGHAPKDEIAIAAAWLSSAVPAILEALVNKASRSD